MLVLRLQIQPRYGIKVFWGQPLHTFIKDVSYRMYKATISVNGIFTFTCFPYKLTDLNEF